MKVFLIMFIAFLSGCAQLMNGQEQPVVLKNAKEHIMYTTCSGSAENFGTCNKKAMRNCANGYSIIDKYEDSNGTIRSLTFKCN